MSLTVSPRGIYFPLTKKENSIVLKRGGSGCLRRLGSLAAWEVKKVWGTKSSQPNISLVFLEDKSFDCHSYAE
jgi:hypothetical protein